MPRRFDFRRTLSTFSLLSLLHPGIASWGSPSPPQTVARIEDHTISLSELDQAGGRATYDALEQLYSQRVRTLYDLLSQEVLKREARARHTTVDALLEQNVTSRVPAPSQADTEAFLKEQGGEKPSAGRDRSQVLAYLTLRARADAKRKYVTQLMKQYGVRISLDPPPEPPAENVPGAMEPLVGPSNAPVTVIVYSDYRCPYCRELVDRLKQLRTHFPTQVRVVYRNLPLHPNSDTLAQAALCAWEQGHFEALHERLFDVDSADPDRLARLAQDSGLQVGPFSTCLQSGKFQSRIEEDRQEADSLKITGTPTLWVNGFRMPGLQSLARLQAQVEEALHPTTLARR